MNTEGFTCGRRYFRDTAEFAGWFEIRSKGFSEWYVPRVPRWSLTNNRHIANCIAALFPEFFHQVRTAEGRAVGYLTTTPGYWSGDVQSLQNLEYIDEAMQIANAKMLAICSVYVVLVAWLRMPFLFERLARRLRPRKLDGANTVFLLAITIDPEYRKHQLPSLLIGAAKKAAQCLGFAYVGSPFRPTGYGDYKKERQAAHSDELFAEYCRSTNSEGLPIDPWLRSVVRQGARLLKLVPRSLTIAGTIRKFERFRKLHRPSDWYSPAPDVWECAETCTWYVDRARKKVVSVEPNCWGIIDLSADPPCQHAVRQETLGD